MSRSDNESNFYSGGINVNNDYQVLENSKKCDESAKKLKFGIDTILSDEHPVSCGSNFKSGILSSTISTNYLQDSFLHYSYQFDNGVEASMHFGPPLFISSAQILPSIRRFTNYVIEADKNLSNSGTSKRKRIWSRAVFSKLQRKGLEKRFQVQKYIMKPDRKQLAASLGLTDAQVKVWFQNRRMKWRNRKENPTNKCGTNKAPD